MSGKNKVYVRIAGKDYTLVGVESDEYIQKIAMYIDKKMIEIMKVNSKLSTSMAAVLTAINVADDYVKAHESEHHLKKELKHINEEVEKLKDENRRLSSENALLSGKGTNLQLELAKREAELHEVRNSQNKQRM
jgi:cell division protein ZapA